MTAADRYPFLIRTTRPTTYKGGMTIEAGEVLPARLGRTYSTRMCGILGIPLNSHPGFTVQHPRMNDPLISCHIPAVNAERITTA